MKQRMLTGIVAGGAFILVLWLGGAWFSGLMLLLALIGYDEYLRMIGQRGSIASTALGGVGVIALAVPWRPDWLTVEWIVWALLFVLFAMTVVTKNRLTIDHAALIFIGVLYIGIGFHYMIETRLLESNGLVWTILVFACIWAADSGAYFAGVAFGRTPLWPAISPKKTVEGALGGLLLSAVVALAVSWYKPELLSYSNALLLGLVAAIVGQFGDLIQSAYKRVKGIKDTGALLPGHGGVLDRTDSWLIVFPFVHLFALIPSM